MIKEERGFKLRMVVQKGTQIHRTPFALANAIAREMAHRVYQRTKARGNRNYGYQYGEIARIESRIYKRIHPRCKAFLERYNPKG